MIGVFWAALRFQVTHVRSSANELMILVTLPLFTVAFLAVLLESGRADLAPYAVVGTAVMGLWSMAVTVSGGAIENDRRQAVLEAMLATPASFLVVLLGRICAVTAISQLALLEGVLIAWAGFGVQLPVHHPGVLLLTLVATNLAVVGTATALAGVFVLGRWALTFKSSLTYPFYVLSGAVVPIVFLPTWLRPLSRLTFLSWTADLMRDSMRPAPPAEVPLRLAMILLLGLAAFLLGIWVVRRILHRLRATGSVTYA